MLICLHNVEYENVGLNLSNSLSTTVFVVNNRCIIRIVVENDIFRAGVGEAGEWYINCISWPGNTIVQDAECTYHTAYHKRAPGGVQHSQVRLTPPVSCEL